MMNAKQLRERFDDVYKIQDVIRPYDDWPEQSVEEQRLKALFGVVGDIVIWIEEQEEGATVWDGQKTKI